MKNVRVSIPVPVSFRRKNTGTAAWTVAPEPLTSILVSLSLSLPCIRKHGLPVGGCNLSNEIPLRKAIFTSAGMCVRMCLALERVQRQKDARQMLATAAATVNSDSSIDASSGNSLLFLLLPLLSFGYCF